MRRITETDLNGVAARINRMTGSPLTPYHKDTSGQQVRHPGCYYISYEYSGVALRQILACGGEADVFGGPMLKRQLYNHMHSFIKGYEAHQYREAKEGQ